MQVVRVRVWESRGEMLPHITRQPVSSSASDTMMASVCWQRHASSGRGGRLSVGWSWRCMRAIEGNRWDFNERFDVDINKPH